MIRIPSGSRPATNRWYRPGSSLRLARSPVAPNRTMTWLCGRWVPWERPVMLRLLLRVAAELRPHRRQDLAGERAVVAGLEPLVERGGDDRHRDALLDARQDGPAALAGVRHVPAEVAEVRRLG